MSRIQPHVKFSRICLLSEKERAGISLEIPPEGLFVIGENGYGKSVIAKAIYYTLGAVPHDINDQEWVKASASYLLEFSVDNQKYTAIRINDRFILYKDKVRILSTNQVGAELMPALASIFNFNLMIKHQNGKLVSPPPSYIFAPYYIDQDGGWQATWNSFKDFYLPDSRNALAEYHSGIRPGGYYAALNERVRAETLIEDAKARDRSLGLLEADIATSGEANFDFDTDSFYRRAADLLAQMRELNLLISEEMSDIERLEEERGAWLDQISVFDRSIIEISRSKSKAEALPSKVYCPSCGQDYENGILERFGLIADTAPIRIAKERAEAEISELDLRIREKLNETDRLANLRRKIRQTLHIRDADVTLEEVIQNRATSLLAAQVANKRQTIVSEINENIALVSRSSTEMRRASQSKTIISTFLKQSLIKAFNKIDVTVELQSLDISGRKLARGSEGARSILAYYIAFVETAMNFGSSAVFPMVIDSPRQQGQDKGHVKQIYELMDSYKESGIQFIGFTEYDSDSSIRNLPRINIMNEKKKILRVDHFEEAKQIFDSYLSV